MRATWLIRSLLAALLLSACAPGAPPPINSPQFVRRPPQPGQPGYLETIRFIADGLHYVSASASFFVSPTGEMCFQGLPNDEMNPYVVPGVSWCISPLAVASVDPVKNGITYVNGVRLWCRHSAPQCAHKIGQPNLLDRAWIANSITADTVPFRQQRQAITHLIYLMGGDASVPAAMPFPAKTTVDTPL
jgi:hypothetical protein